MNTWETYLSCRKVKRNLFKRNVQNRMRLKGSPFNFFGAVRFFSNIFQCLQRLPSIFRYFATNWMRKSPKGPLLKILIFSEIKIFYYPSTNNFFNPMRSLRYIRTILRFTNPE